MKEIKAFIFDLGNVLIFFDWKIANEKLNQIEEGLGEKTTQFLKNNHDLIYKLETGKIEETQFLNEVKKNVDSNVSLEELAKIYSEIFWENEALTRILPELKKNYTLYLLSNTNLIHRKYGWDKYSFLKNFDRLFLSYEIGFVKPDKEIYQFVISNIPFTEKEILYIDDIQEYIEAAKSLGWNAIKFSSNDDLFRDLERLNFKLN
jgi:putative hydrolase of the HAD superfamily